MGQKIYPPNNLEKLIQDKDVYLIFLAIPSIGRNKRNEIIKKLNKFNLIVKTLPSISKL